MYLPEFEILQSMIKFYQESSLRLPRFPACRYEVTQKSESLEGH